MSQGKALDENFWDEFLDELKNNLGHVRMTCQKMGIAHQTYYRKVQDSPKFLRASTRIIDNMCIPVLENIAYTKALSGDTGMIKFMLKNRGGLRWQMDVMEELITRASFGEEMERRLWERHLKQEKKRLKSKTM